MLRLRLTLRASSEIARAEAWWLENRPFAQKAFAADLSAALELLLRQPGAGTKVARSRVVGVRRLHLGRIRYYLFYRVSDEELIVLALWHSSRKKGPAV